MDLDAEFNVAGSNSSMIYSEIAVFLHLYVAFSELYDALNQYVAFDEIQWNAVNDICRLVPRHLRRLAKNTDHLRIVSYSVRQCRILCG